MKRELSAHAVGNRAYLALVIAGGVLAVVGSVHQLATTIAGSRGWSWPPLPSWAGWRRFVCRTFRSASRSPTRSPSPPRCFSGLPPALSPSRLTASSFPLSSAKRNFALRQLLFNATAPALAMWAGGARVLLACRRPCRPVDVVRPLLRAPSVVFTGLYFVLNTGSIAIAIAFDQRNGPFAIWRRHFLPLWLTYFGGAAVAALLFVLVSSARGRPGRPRAGGSNPAHPLRRVQERRRADGRPVRAPRAGQPDVPRHHRGAGHGDQRQGRCHARPHQARPGVRRGAGARARRRRRHDHQGHRGRGAAPRHGKARRARAHPEQARQAHARRVREDEAARRRRRGHPVDDRLPLPGRADRPVPPRELGRQRIPARPDGRRDSDRRAHPVGRRLLRRAHLRSAVPPRAHRRGGVRRS